MIDWAEARAMWRDGFDTKDIADALGVDEAEIYNGLAQGRGIEHAAVAA